MEKTSRDDFSIAVRSAFLKKGVKQKFSLLALIIASIILLSLEAINSKSLNFVRSAIKDVIYRTSFIASIPGNSFAPSITKIQNYFEVHEQYEIVKSKLQQLENQQNQINYLKLENDKLKKIIDDNIFSGAAAQLRFTEWKKIDEGSMGKTIRQEKTTLEL